MKFRYPLEAVRQWRETRVELAQGRLAAAQLRCSDIRAQLTLLESDYREQALRAASQWQRAADPRAHAMQLQALAQLQGRAVALHQRLALADAEIGEALWALQEAQQDAQALERDRDRQLQEHRLAASRRACVQDDEAWSMRLGRGEAR